MTQFESLLNVHFDSDQERALMHIMCSGTQIFHEMELLTKKFKLKVVHFHILLVLKEGQGIPLNLKTIKARIIDKREIDSKHLRVLSAASKRSDFILNVQTNDQSVSRLYQQNVFAMSLD